MKVFISPAKTMNFATKETPEHTTPHFIHEANTIMKQLKKLSVEEIEKAFKVNKKLASSTFDSFQAWRLNDAPSVKPAIFTYHGHLFKNIQLETLSETAINYLNEHVFILSTLYGILKPFDALQAYRLDYLTKLKIENKNFYAFWKEKLTEFVEALDDDVVINLASSEYFKVLDQKKLNKKVVHIVFKEYKNGTYKTMSMSAKKMRGRFLHFMANQMPELEEMKNFTDEGFTFSVEQSDETNFVYLKG